MRRFVSLALGFALSAITLTASAYGNGAGGYTGKQEGRSCNSCHSGGTAPTVAITGPNTLAAGQTGDFTMTITTNQTRASGGIASSAGSLTAGPGLHDEDGELTHDAAKAISGGRASFTFKLTAPASGTTMRLFAVGLASNGSGTGGDRAAQVTKDVTITGGAAEPPPTEPVPPGDDDDDDTSSNGATPGSSSPTDTAADEDATSTQKKKKKSADDEDDDDRPRRDHFNDAAACSMRPGLVDPAGLGASTALLLGLALVARRRKR